MARRDGQIRPGSSPDTRHPAGLLASYTGLRCAGGCQADESDGGWEPAMPRQRHELSAPDYAILGLLMFGPRQGYELLPYFSGGGELGLVCTLGTPRLYAILHALEVLDLVRCETS